MKLQTRVFAIITGLLLCLLLPTVAWLTWVAREEILAQAESDAAVIAQLLAKSGQFAYQIPGQLEQVVSDHMLTEATLAAHLIALSEKAGMDAAAANKMFLDIIDQSVIDEIVITDSNGYAFINKPQFDFTFSPDPNQQPQAHVFWPLLTSDKRQVVQAVMTREVDDQKYKYAAVAGVDKPRIVQVGLNARRIEEISRQVGLEKLFAELAQSGKVLAIRGYDEQMNLRLAEYAPGHEAGDGSMNNLMGLLAAAIEDRQTSVYLDGAYLHVLVPIENPISDARPVLVVTLPTDQLNHSMKRAAKAAGVGVAGCLVFGVLGAFPLASKRLTKPILALVDHVRGISEGDLETEIKIRQTPELVQLSDEINSMTAGLRDRMQLRQSLALAMDVQQNLLPAEAPTVKGLDIAGHSTYCDETGGDYYDYLDVIGLSDAAVAVALGDVVGHGVAAAMLMATARGILVSHCDETASLSELMTHMNDHLVKDVGIDTGRFMTMLLMIVDSEAGELRWASAGHDAPILYDLTDDAFVEFELGGVPLGVLEGQQYSEHQLSNVRAGQVCLAGTDGIWEAENEAGDMYGKDRLREFIRRNAKLSADELSEELCDELRTFCGESKQRDDITFVIVKVTG